MSPSCHRLDTGHESFLFLIAPAMMTKNFPSCFPDLPDNSQRERLALHRQGLALWIHAEIYSLHHLKGDRE